MSTTSITHPIRLSEESLKAVLNKEQRFSPEFEQMIEDNKRMFEKVHDKEAVKQIKL